MAARIEASVPRHGMYSAQQRAGTGMMA